MRARTSHSFSHRAFSRRAFITLIVFLLLANTTSGLAQQSRNEKEKTRKRKGESPMPAEEARNRPLYSGSFALLIGASEYDDNEAWDDLPGVTHDIDELKRALESHGFLVEQLPNPNRKQFRDTLDSFIDRYGFQPDNRLLIYHTGHGTKRSLKDGREVGYLVMRDTPANPGPRENAEEFLRKVVAFDEIDSYARRITARHAMFVFDTCNSGFLLRQRNDPKPDDFILNVVMQPVRFYLTAGNASQKVWDDSQFRRHFIRGINGEADYNNDRFVQGTELGLYLSKNVYKDTGRRQTPLYDKIGDPWLSYGDFVFQLASPAQTTTIAEAVRKADSAWRSGAFSKLEQHAQQALRMEPQNRVAHFYAMLGYLCTKFFLHLFEDDAKLAIEEAGNKIEAEADEIISLVKNPQNSWDFLAKGLAWAVKEEDDRAEQFFAKAIELDPTNANIYFARFLHRNINFDYLDDLDDRDFRDISDESKADLDQAIKCDPAYTIAYFVRGIALMKNEPERTLADFTEAIRLDGLTLATESLAAMFNLLISLGEKKGVGEDIVQLLAVGSKEIQMEFSMLSDNSRANPGAYAYWVRSDLWNDDANHQKMIADITKAIEIAPDVAIFYSERGNTYYDEKKYDEAISDYSEAITLDPRNSIYYQKRADAYIKKKDREKALKDLDKIVALKPLDWSSYYKRYQYYADIGEKEKALEDLAQYISLRPNSWVGYDYRYKYYNKLGEHKLAIEDVTEAIKRCPIKTDDDKRIASALYEQRHATYIKMGNYRAALEDYAKTIDMHPEKTDDERRELSERYFSYCRKLIIFGLYEKVSSALKQGANSCGDNLTCSGAYREIQEKYDEWKRISDLINSSTPVSSEKWKLFEQSAKLYVFFSCIDAPYKTDFNRYNIPEGYKRAADDFKSAIEFCPERDEKLKLYISRGEALYDAANAHGNDIQAAIANYTVAIAELYANSLHLLELYKKRSGLYVNNEKYDSALDDINKAISLNATIDNYQIAELYDQRGGINRNLGNYEQAVKDYTTAIEKYPALSKYYLQHRSEAWQKLGKAEEAKKDELAVAEIEKKEKNKSQ